MKKNPYILIIGLFLTGIAIFLSINSYNTTYQQSRIYSNEIDQIKKEISDIDTSVNNDNTSENQTISDEKQKLNQEKDKLSELKLQAEKPYSYALTFTFFSIMLTAFGLYKLLKKDSSSAKSDLNKLAQAGLLAALCYIGFAFFKIDIPVGPEKTAFHLGNVFCVLASLLLGGFWGGLSGAVGMTIADLTTAYATSAPKTFLLKLCIGLIVGLIAHSIFKIDKHTNKKYIAVVTILASTCGMAFNVVADPLVGYFYKTYLLGIPQDISKTLAKLSAVTSLVNAIIAIIAASIFYLALRPALMKAGLLVHKEQKSVKK